MVQKFAVDECGPVHIIIGDGGNIEGVCKPTASCLCLCHSKLPFKAASHKLLLKVEDIVYT